MVFKDSGSLLLEAVKLEVHLNMNSFCTFSVFPTYRRNLTSSDIFEFWSNTILHITASDRTTE